MTLGPRQKAIVGSANKHAILAEFGPIRSNWTKGAWLLKRNQYRIDPCTRLDTDFDAGKTAVHRHLREYIASSAITHCMDGWAFLGRAMSAELQGDPDISRHLGYYAELRAAMALLAAEGIGVFDKHHVVVNNRSKCECFVGAGRTHAFTWDALECWANTSSAAQLLFGVIRPGGIPLKEWLDQFSSGAGMQGILAEEWLLQWGLDIQRLRADRDARNFASYRPTAFTSPGASSISDSLALAQGLWHLCEPIGSERFAALDRHLLRSSLEKAFRATHASGRTHKQASHSFKQRIARMLHGLAPIGLGADQWREFLRYEDGESQSEILTYASGTADERDRDHSRQVLARAMLLLRVATGASAALLESLPNLNRAEMQFWWSRLGSERGLWNDGNPPATFTDMWADVLDGMIAVADWLSKVPAQERSRARFWKERPAAASVLGACERVGFWGLGL